MTQPEYEELKACYRRRGVPEPVEVTAEEFLKNQPPIGIDMDAFREKVRDILANPEKYSRVSEGFVGAGFTVQW